MIPNHPFSLLLPHHVFMMNLSPYSLQISLQFLPDLTMHLMTLSYTYMILTLLLYLPMCLTSV